MFAILRECKHRREREDWGKRLRKCLRWLHTCGVDNRGCRGERESMCVCVCMCLNENLMALVQLRELRLLRL